MQTAKFLATIVLFFLMSGFSFAQQWAGSDTTIDNIYRNGNVGIGTKNPTATLHLKYAFGPGLNFEYGTGYRAHINFFENSTARAAINWADDTNEFQFLPGLNPTMVIEEGGNVGIGTTDPKAKLHSNSPGNIPSFLSSGSSADFAVLKGQNMQFGHWDDVSQTFTERMKIDGGGKVGIGTTEPLALLDVMHTGTLTVLPKLVPDEPKSSPNEPIFYVRTRPNLLGAAVSLFKVTESRVLIGPYDTDGDLPDSYDLAVHGAVAIGKNIGDGIFPDGYKLAVDGKVIAEEVTVQLRKNWPDYVFDENYELKTLDEVEDFIKGNQRLPDMPTATEVEANGVSLGEMQAKLLQKVEELTLYVIAQNKELRTLKKENDLLKGQVVALERRMKQ
jgi:hypothetical protein